MKIYNSLKTRIIVRTGQKFADGDCELVLEIKPNTFMSIDERFDTDIMEISDN